MRFFQGSLGLGNSWIYGIGIKGLYIIAMRFEINSDMPRYFTIQTF